MSERIVVRSDSDSHVLFSMFKAYYPNAGDGVQAYYDHKHVGLEISCILSGAGKYTCGGAEYPFSPGDVFSHCGNEIHYFSFIHPGAKPSLLVLHFDPGFIWLPSGEWSSPMHMKLFSGSCAVGRRMPHDSPQTQSVAGLLEEMFAECAEHKPAYDLVVKAKLMTILAYMVRYYSPALDMDAGSPANKRHLAQMELSTRNILSHLCEPLTLEQLAKDACMSRSYYSTIFKALNGVSVWDYIIGHRIDLARYKLETTACSVMQISEESGFTSIGNFNRAFKKLTGKTPREYRRQQEQHMDVTENEGASSDDQFSSSVSNIPFR